MSIIAIFPAIFCGGEEVSNLVAEKLGYRFIDDRILEGSKDTFGIPADRLIRSMHDGPSFFNKLTHEYERNLAYIKIMLADALKNDNLVYQGYAVHLIPASITHVLKVCLIAEKKYRIKQAMAAKGMNQKEAAKIIKHEDGKMSQWTQYLFELTPWDKRLYDIKIPMHKTSLEEAVELIAENAQIKAVSFTSRSLKAVEDFKISSLVELQLLKEGEDLKGLKIYSNEGNVTIEINKTVVRLEHYKRSLEEMVKKVKGVKDAQSKVGADYQYPSVYRTDLFELPSKILLVDDEKEFVQTLSERLQMRDMAPQIAYNGEEALDYVDQEEPEVMVLDLRMPGIDGIDVLRRIKREHPKVEVIILTGHGTDRDERAAKELGAFAYLQKPVNIDILTQTLKAAYDKAKKDRGDEVDGTGKEMNK